MAKIPHRASPLPPEERKAAIIRAVIPAMIEHGASLTSRQIAEAAGVAEGTIFRVFGDKDTLLREAADAYLDPAPVRASLAGIDASWPLEEKIGRVLHVLRDRFRGVISVMSAIGYKGDEPPHLRNRPPQGGWEYVTIVAKAVEPELRALNIPPEDVAPYIRLVAFATSIPAFNQETAFADQDLTRLLTYGIAGRAATDEDDAALKRAAASSARKRREPGRAVDCGPASGSSEVADGPPTTENESVSADA